MIEFIKGTKIDFMGLRKYAFALSAAMVLVGLFGIVQAMRGEANLGIDLAGGTSLQLKFARTLDLDKVRATLSSAGMGHATLQLVEGENLLLVKVAGKGDSEKMVGDKVVAALKGAFPDNPPAVESVSEIGPAIGQKLRTDAIFAMAISALAIIVYLAWRFEFKFGVAAAVATYHDVLIMVGAFYLLGREMDLLFITALLTIAGYSLTDTVVVFDRVRENVKLRKGATFSDVINISVNEVLSRSIITSLTVFITCVCMLLFGGVVLRDFALALTIGIVVGAYSSIFVASPIVALWRGEKLTEVKN